MAENPAGGASGESVGTEFDALLEASTRRIGHEPGTDPLSDLDRLESRDLDNLDKEDDSSLPANNSDGQSGSTGDDDDGEDDTAH